jgi:glycosyltransferase involved in cell wall biosynthesis
MSSRISIAMGTHNGAPYIAEQVRSMVSQTVQPHQLVLSDDASTDGTVEIAEAELRSLHDAGMAVPELLVLRNPAPLGVTHNFEQALAATDGELVALADQDDRWHPRKLELMNAEFDANPELLLMSSDARLIDAGGDIMPGSLLNRLELDAHTVEAMRSEAAFATLLRRNTVTGATVMLRKRLIPLARPFPDLWLHDEWLAIVASSLGDVRILEEELIDYRLHGQNQVGVRAPTIMNKIRRVLEPGGDRNEQLWRRAEVLSTALSAGPMAVSEEKRALARGKARFERARAALPSSRIRRVLPVLQQLSAGNYRRFASQGNLDVVRDILQPR